MNQQDVAHLKYETFPWLNTDVNSVTLQERLHEYIYMGLCVPCHVYLLFHMTCHSFFLLHNCAQKHVSK